MAVNAIRIDTNAYAALKRGDAEAISIVQRAPFIAMSSTVLGELLGGFAAGAKETQNRQELEVFLASPRVRLHVVDRETAETFDAHFRKVQGLRVGSSVVELSAP